jgi:hypothetical protein
MYTILSLVTSVKDYIEVVHKLIESNNTENYLINPNGSGITNYNEFGSILTYTVITLKNSISDFFSLKLSNWSLPIMVPDVSSAMISEISVLDGNLHNSFNLLDLDLGGKYGEQNGIVYGFEKLVIGLINSCFFIIPTSAAHIITLRRFVMQGLEAGYIAGLGTIAGNIFWIASIVLGFRFFVIPWLSFDIFRYILGFMLLIKYMWDSYNTTAQNRMVLEDLNKQKIFLLNFLLALTEQSSLYPFITNLSIGPDSSILESFPAQNYPQFIFVHFCYLLGLVLGSLSLLHLTCWFMENPAFKIYMWAISSFKVSTSFYYKFLNFGFLYLTMICAMTSIPYYGLDYTITNPLGFVYDDRILDSSPSGNKTLLPETAFINSKASDKNTRRNRGRHGRRERWKRRIRKYRTFDASLYDNGVYDLFTIEDLNYGFDRFWLRRKMRNHRVRFRFFPGPWMRSFKKQLIKKGVESYAGPRQEFFRILFEQVYHPSFHKYNTKASTKVSSTALPNSGQKPVSAANLNYSSYGNSSNSLSLTNLYSSKNFLDFKVQKSLVSENSTLRKFIRKVNNRIKTSEILSELNSAPILSRTSKLRKSTTNETANLSIHNLFSKLYSQNGNTVKMKPYYTVPNTVTNKNLIFQPLTNTKTTASKEGNTNDISKGQLLHPLKFYLKKQQAFERKLRYYTPTVFRKFSIENNAPYFRVMMKRFFYYYKPTLRWEKTMKVASLRKARRKTSRIPRKLMNYNSNETISTNVSLQSFKDNTNTLGQTPENILYKGTDMIQKPTHNYTVVGKRASRYRYQIYKDVLQHWYYSPFNRFLLKLDVDSFIRRQPKSHFLTKNEENNLHLKRFLLYEHYNTLRWYTYMQHYRSMKSKIGGSKSFSSNLYNQQFMGTFKKIRHLFAITPSQNNKTILKFDTPLYNNYSPEYYTSASASASMNNTKSLADNLNAPGLHSILHEELFAQNLSNPSQGAQPQLNDLVGQSTFVLRDYLKTATPIREEMIKKLIKEKNYTELTEFLYKGQKTRGIKPITNTKDLNNQEFDSLFSSIEKEQALNELNTSSPMNKYKNLLENKDYKQDLWISLLKKWKRSVNDGTFLKNYISRRVEKREKRKQKKEKNLRNKLAKLKSWLENTTSSGMLGDGNINLEQTLNFVTNSSTLSSGSVKAINDGIKTVSSTQGNLSSSPKTNLQNSLILYSQIKKEKEIVTSLKTIKAIYSELNNDGSTQGKKKLARNLNKYLTKISSLSIMYKNKIQDYLQLQKVLNLFSPLKRKTLNKEFWRKQERALNKQKKSRKEFSRLTKIKTTNKSSKYNNDYYFSSEKGQRDFLNQENQLEASSSLELRKKRDQFTDLGLTNTNKTQFNDIYNSITKTNSESSNVLNSYKSIFTKQFKRKKSPQRRARIRRNRSVIRKRTLADTLKREFKNLQKTNKIANSEAIYEPTGQKQRQTKIRKRRVWKDKRAKYSKKQSKYRKRRRNVLGKIRILNKQLKRIQSTTYVKNWWWNTFLPSIRANTDALWQIEKEQLMKEKLQELTDNEILKRDPFTNSLLQQGNVGVRDLEQNSLNQKYLQIGDKDFKPLALPLAMQLKENLLQKTTPEQNTNNPSPNSYGLTSSTENISLTEKLYNNILVEHPKQNLINSVNVEGIAPQTPFLTSTTSIPFYAGWDESLRKFVVTNRLLSRRQAGFAFNSELFNTSNENNKNSSASSLQEKQDIEFTSAPLKGMNAPTTLYWQIPFTTYDPDQFYALGMDGFAPIGWRRFNFRHTILKSWLYYLSSPEYKKGTTPFTKDFNGNKNLNNANLLNASLPFPFGDGEEAAPLPYPPIPFFEGAASSPRDSLSLKGRGGEGGAGISTYQPMIVKGKTSISGTKNLDHSLVYKLNQKNNFITTKAYFTEGLFKENSETNKNKKNISRRLKKRYKRVRRHPRAPVWFPSGPLLNQVLPVHYIYVFYKRSRLPRDRYIKRRLQKQSTTNMYGDQKGINGPSTNVDFTLRKRVKTKRKYHRKKDNIALRPIPKRIKFYGYDIANSGDNFSKTMSRPIKLARRKIPIAEIIREQRLTRTKQRKSSTNKQPSMRVKQLRRRVQQQIIRSVWRYRPRAGGFVWPGDYLRLELVKAPKLQQNNLDKTNLVISEEKTQKTKALTTGAQRKMKRKKKRAVKEWQIQPKTYLLEKHNIRVLKKKLQKANHSNQFKQRLKELNYIV